MLSSPSGGGKLANSLNSNAILLSVSFPLSFAQSDILKQRKEMQKARHAPGLSHASNGTSYLLPKR